MHIYKYNYTQTWTTIKSINTKTNHQSIRLLFILISLSSIRLLFSLKEKNYCWLVQVLVQFTSARHEANLHIDKCGHVNPTFQEGISYRNSLFVRYCH